MPLILRQLYYSGRYVAGANCNSGRCYPRATLQVHNSDLDQVRPRRLGEFTSKVVIQKVDTRTGTICLYQNFDLRSPWSFETSRLASHYEPNLNVFPFCFGEQERFVESWAGSETKIQMSGDNQLLFADDYAVPGGFLVGVLFSEGFAPEVFKSKPFIPTGIGSGGASVSPLGHFDVKYNQFAKLSAVIFLITQPTYFGFKCIARKRHGDFLNGGNHLFMSDLFATLDFVEEDHDKCDC